MFEERIAVLNEERKKRSKDASAQNDKRTYTVDEIQDILGIGRSGAYKLVKSNLFQSVKIGSTIRISKKSFDAWLDGME